MPGDQLPDECEYIAGPVEQGWRVITVWSRARRSTGSAYRSYPAIQELAGEDSPPAVDPEVNPVHKLVKR